MNSGEQRGRRRYQAAANWLPADADAFITAALATFPGSTLLNPNGNPVQPTQLELTPEKGQP